MGFQALMKHSQTSLDVLTDMGASILANAVGSSDANPDIVKYLLSCSLKYGANYQRKITNTKWKLICGLSRGLVRIGVVKSGLFADVASYLGATPLQWAAFRGDL